MGQLVDYKYYYVLSTTVELRNKKITERQTCAPPNESRIAGWGGGGGRMGWGLSLYLDGLGDRGLYYMAWATTQLFC